MLQSEKLALAEFYANSFAAENAEELQGIIDEAFADNAGDYEVIIQIRANDVRAYARQFAVKPQKPNRKTTVYCNGTWYGSLDDLREAKGLRGCSSSQVKQATGYLTAKEFGKVVTA